VRAPLTDADRANGYTAGRLLILDARFLSGVETEVDAYDVHAEWPLSLRGGRLRLYADATRQLQNTQRQPFQPDVKRAGYRNGPLKRRVNGGFDWSLDRLTLGANWQYFGGNSIIDSGPFDSPNATAVHTQGGARVPSQSYLDLNAAWR